MSDVVKILEAARKVIETPEKWTKGFFAQTSEGVNCYTDSPHAVCFCASGAVQKAWLENGAGVYEARAILSSIVSNYKGGIPEFNDALETTHADVLEVFDTAIEVAKLGGF
jgi:hypothetical protein